MKSSPGTRILRVAAAESVSASSSTSTAGNPSDGSPPSWARFDSNSTPAVSSARFRLARMSCAWKSPRHRLTRSSMSAPVQMPRLPTDLTHCKQFETGRWKPSVIGARAGKPGLPQETLRKFVGLIRSRLLSVRDAPTSVRSSPLIRAFATPSASENSPPSVLSIRASFSTRRNSARAWEKPAPRLNAAASSCAWKAPSEPRSSKGISISPSGEGGLTNNCSAPSEVGKTSPGASIGTSEGGFDCETVTAS